MTYCDRPCLPPCFPTPTNSLPHTCSYSLCRPLSSPFQILILSYSHRPRLSLPRIVVRPKNGSLCLSVCNSLSLSLSLSLFLTLVHSRLLSVSALFLCLCWERGARLSWAEGRRTARASQESRAGGRPVTARAWRKDSDLSRARKQ